MDCCGRDGPVCQALSEVPERRKQRKEFLHFSSSLRVWLLLQHTDCFPVKMCSNFYGDSCHACPRSLAFKIFTHIAHFWPQAGLKQDHYRIFELLGRICFSCKENPILSLRIPKYLLPTFTLLLWDVKIP